ncbi:MAG: lipid II flippase MurJ [Schaedlerella sp.]|nr:lipid II flippase MurJ [Schaedlerella sp.]
MKKSISKAISMVMIITLACRVLALISNQFYMSYFGASDIELNIYSYAISVPNAIFNSVGTAISTVIIPIYATLIVEKKNEEANLFASNVLTIFGSIIIFLVIIGMCLAPVLPKFTDFNTGKNYEFAVKSLIIIMPVMLFYGVSYVFQGVLQSLGSFYAVAAVSLPSSCVIIVYLLLFAEDFGVIGLLWTTFVGLMLQALILIPPAIKKGFRFTLCYDRKNPYVKQAFSLIGPIILGSGAFQINMFYNVTLTANFDNMVTLLTFIQNLVLNTVLAIVYSVTAVLYPKMTAELAEKKEENYKITLTEGMDFFIFLFLPATIGIISVRTELLSLISGYGKITEKDINTAGIFLALYSMAFVSIALKELLDRAFFAAKQTRIPALCGFITVITNVIFSQIFIRYIGVYGIPLSYTVSSFCAMLFLLYNMRRKIGRFGKKSAKNLITSVFSTVLMGVFVHFAIEIIPSFDGIIGRIINLGIPVMTGMTVYFIVALLLKNPVILYAVKNLNIKRKVLER